MTRAMLLAVALVLASAANAADEPAPGTPKKTQTKPPSKSSSKASKDKPSTGKASPATKGESGVGSSGSADPAQLAEVFRAKTNLLFAVEACDRPERCDKVFRSEAEARFMKACLECAPQERCEADRQTIRDGNGKRSYNPCSAK